MTGKFIVIYGPNNTGKSKQAELLRDNLSADAGVPYITTIKYPIAEIPSGVEINKQIRVERTLSEEALQELYAQNRRDFEPDLKEFLGAGVWVLAEDYKHTGVAWGMAHGVDRNRLEEMNSGLLEPDLAILLDGERFSSGIEARHHFEQGNWEKARRYHLELAREYGWQIVDSNRGVSEVEREIYDIVQNKFFPKKGTVVIKNFGK